MSEKGDQKFLDKLADQLTSPWDWVAAGAGAIVGLAGSIFTAGADGGTLTGAGAMAGVTLKQAGTALRTASKLKARYKAVRAEFDRFQQDKDMVKHRDRLDSFNRLWESKGVGNDRFVQALDEATRTITDYPLRLPDEDPIEQYRTRAITLEP